MYVFQAERYVAKDRFRFSSTIIVGCYHPKKLKIERQQKAKLREKLNAPIFTIRVLFFNSLNSDQRYTKKNAVLNP